MLSAYRSPRFTVGERVMRRDRGEDWQPGYVTQVDPLRVTASRDDPSAQGFRLDEVRKIDVDQVVNCFYGVISNTFGNILNYSNLSAPAIDMSTVWIQAADPETKN